MRQTVSNWWQLLVLGLVFAVLGGVLLVVGLPDGGAQAALIAGTLFAVLGVGMAVWSFVVRRDQRIGGGEMRPVDGSGAIPSDGVWPFEAIAAELTRVLAGTPFVVEHNGERIRVRADLADARFLTFGGVRRVARTAAVDVIRKEHGVAVTVDSVLGLQWSAGVDGSAIPRLSGSASVFTGKAWSWGKRVEWGVGADGRWGRQVDYTFSSKELKQPVSQTLERAGWRERWPAEARGAVVMAVIGGSSVVIVPLAFLIRSLTS